MSDTRLVITGMGAVTNLGHNAPDTWDAMRSGRSGITPVQGDEFEEFEGRWATRIMGQIHDWDPTTVLDKREAKRLDRVTHLGMVAAEEAVKDSGVDFEKEDPERCGVILGSGIGGIGTIENSVRVLVSKGPDRINPFTVPRLMANATSGNVSIRYGLKGPATTHATACASSGHAIGDAMDIMRKGRADVMILGGTEAACTPLCLGAFMTMKALSERNDDPTAASRPFDRDRDGFVLSEGAAMYVVETEAHAKARGAKIYAELVGAADGSDAGHITAPDAGGLGASRSMRWALEDAKLNPTDIGYVNAHGTSTPLGDKAEIAAAMVVFGDHARKSAGGTMVMSSTKSMHGHCLGASGAVELIACIHAVREGVIAPTINLDNPDEGTDIELVANTAQERDVRYAMNNTFGFGGHNVTLVIGRYDG